MQAMKFIETVTKDGLYLNNPELLKYLNQEVEITILPVYIEDSGERKKKLMELAGSLDDEDAKIFYEALDECRQVYPESWK